MANHTINMAKKTGILKREDYGKAKRAGIALPEKKIMIVDDDKSFLAELKDLLASLGYDIAAFSDSRCAFSSISAVKPGVILLDLKMDGINGLQFIEKVRRSSVFKNVPIIVMTGFNIDCREYPYTIDSWSIDKWLRKPFHILDLVAAIEEPKEAMTEAG